MDDGLSIRTKILLTIALACLFSWLVGCLNSNSQPLPKPAPNTLSLPETTVNVTYLQHRYAEYNEMYFRSRLTRRPRIDMLEKTKKNMATTFCNDGMSDCTLSFNERYNAAPRSADENLLHEMCHVKTWDTDVVYFAGHVEQADHGRVWRACMLELDAAGAFREIIIDNYQEKR